MMISPFKTDDAWSGLVLRLTLGLWRTGRCDDTPVARHERIPVKAPLISERLKAATLPYRQLRQALQLKKDQIDQMIIASIQSVSSTILLAVAIAASL